VVIFKKNDFKKIKKFYKKNGYVCVKSLVNKKSINNIYSSIVDIYNKYSSNKIKLQRNIYKDNEFHKKLVNFRKSNHNKYP
jgi:hypothetical protein